MTVKGWVIDRIPARYQLPLRYYYRRLRGRLEKEVALVPDLVRDGDTAIDIGASYGIYSYVLAQCCHRVHAFEPLPQCAEVIRAFGAPNVSVHQVALSSTDGRRRLFVPREAGRLNVESAGWKMPDDGHVIVEVDVRTLDEYNIRNVCFIKIDVEGHELDVLKGAARTIDRERPTLLVEIEQRHLICPMQIVFDYLSEFGYRGFFFHDGGLRSLSEFSSDVHQRQFVPNVLARDYVNNFVFLA